MSKLIRRTHMYLALFLAPWVAGYALSTMLMSHQLIAPQTFVVEREVAFDGVFAPDTSRDEQARQILAALDLDGAFGVQGPGDDGRLTINRQSILTPRRIVYRPAERRLTVEKAEFSVSSYLGRFHRRRGYGPDHAADRTMAASVDAVVVAMVFWSLSGVWMWWEMRTTRRLGALCLGAGLAVFFVAVWWL